MKHISIIIPRGHTSVVNIEGTHQLLASVNDLLLKKGKAPIFDIQLVGISRETTLVPGLYTVKPDRLIGEVRKTDMIIIPAVHGDPQAAVADNYEFIPWIVEQYKSGCEVVSLCVGAFFLASTGLLDGKQCATHWMFANEFRNMFPQVHLVDDKIMTEEQGIYTSGGAYSYPNLILYLIEKFAGREIAILTSKTFMIDIDRESQSPFIMFQGQRSHEDDLIKKAQDYIEDNFQEKITVNELADMLALGRRSLERRFKKATCNTVTEYIQRVKIEAAKKSFETSRKNINEVMYDVGYTDTKAFRTVFKKITNLSPVEYKNKYNREAAFA
ncbi:transcriptional regulator, AraC family [Fulvivirga imtechensis AK7]|uniref:Transcriptional regulator, AraC family n=1 Tax=Fulvivirga imtechensis AK7 TaxID=1237149 RepID=L8JWC1_9BACT|nr:helix-turn-helix domain-containing protein [Fulvivirga imtechensis]ELR73331.1 transcriptional regulator, AraC family [Fulvivirga imtechensis AK7]